MDDHLQEDRDVHRDTAQSRMNAMSAPRGTVLAICFEDDVFSSFHHNSPT